MIKISAVVCTFKRPDYLRQALRSLGNQTLPAHQYEILVVDNAGESETKCVVKDFERENLNLRYVIEGKVGLSRARNKGLREARGRYIAYLDDDARADEHWLEELGRSFEETTPAPAAVGGRVWLDWRGEKPAWIPDDRLSLFTYVDHGEEGHALRDNEYLAGANLAFDKEVLRAVGGFDTSLGRQGEVLLSGEEARVLQQLIDSGRTVYYEPAALVWHSVHPSRQRRTWLVKRMFWDGATQPFLDRNGRGRFRGLVLRSLFSDARQCLGWAASALAATVRGRKQDAWQSLLGLSQRAGRVRTEVRMLAWRHD
jgi:glycosyltransferase involved in cell wall biosynthesis